jgi:uncharacterized protein
MTAPAYNTVAWFQVGTTDAEQAKQFYGDLFGWRYTLDPNSEGKYHLVGYPGADAPSGGIFDTGGEFPNHAIFMVVVQDVAAVCAQVERLGPPSAHGHRSTFRVFGDRLTITRRPGWLRPAFCPARQSRLP